MTPRAIILTLSTILVITVITTTAAFGQQNDGMDMSNSSGANASAALPVVFDLANGTAQLKLSWEPAAINIDGPTTFTFEFVNASNGERLQNVSYSVHMSLSGASMGHAHEGTAPGGVDTLEQEFDTTGPLSIILESIKVGDAELDDVAQVNLTVVPEFPALLVTVIMSVVLTASIFLSRLHFRKSMGVP